MLDKRKPLGFIWPGPSCGGDVRSGLEGGLFSFVVSIISFTLSFLASRPETPLVDPKQMEKKFQRCTYYVCCYAIYIHYEYTYTHTYVYIYSGADGSIDMFGVFKRLMLEDIYKYCLVFLTEYKFFFTFAKANIQVF